MKKFNILAVTGMMLLATSAYADNTLSTTVENNNFLGIGQPGINRSQGEINSHLNPLQTPFVPNIEYFGPVLKDHKIQDEILNFMLSDKGLRPFKIKTTGLFSRNITKTESKCVLPKPLKKQNVVYVFKSKDELKGYKYQVVGYIDTYSDGDDDETLMQCFDQAILDSGEMGANAMLLLKTDFTAGVKSTTVGLGSSGTSGHLHGGSGASVGGAAIGYASSKANPRTNPYIHGIAIHISNIR